MTIINYTTNDIMKMITSDECVDDTKRPYCLLRNNGFNLVKRIIWFLEVGIDDYTKQREEGKGWD